MGKSLAEILHGSPVDTEDVKRLIDILTFQGTELGAKFFKFACLLVLAAAIATFGLLGDSLAVIIGAMIVAPLMLPIMGLAFGISIGDRSTIFTTMIVSFAGIVMAVAVGFFLTLPIAGVTHPEAITQIMIRTSPHLLDLMAALVTGLAGAFALSRRDVSDTLPGVAIAVSLVPPLANVGILLALGKIGLASGSFLLFVTNYVAILLTGSLVFAVMGFRQVALSPFDLRTQQRAVVITLVALLFITIPLSITSYNLFITNKIAARTYALGQKWLDGSGYRLMNVDAETEDGTVNLFLLGNGNLPPMKKLEETTNGLLSGRTIRVKIVESQTLYVGKQPR